MSKRRHRQLLDAAPRGPSPEVLEPEPPFPREDAMKPVSIRESGSPTQTEVVDALDSEIDAVWGLVACLQTIFTEHSGDPYIKAALRLANGHLDALSAIRCDVDRL